MFPGSRNPRELGFYFALAQVGLEMVVPLGLGLFLDFQFGWNPWGLIVGTIFGFTGSLFHLVALLQRHDREEKQKDKTDEG